MKAYKKRQFSLIELMFVVGVLVILISISWVAGRKVIKEQTKQKMRAEIVTLVKAVELYKIRYGTYPPNDTSATPHPLSFAETLSDVKPNSGWSGKRTMYINFKKNNFKVSNENYDDSNATSTKVLDPYGNTYLYFYDSANEKFFIWSVGADGVENSNDDFTGIGADGSFGDDITSKNIFK